MVAAPASFYFFDYETLGRQPAWDRPAQFAGIRTDTNFNIIGEPCMLYCRPADDYLPEPGACRVTGITPERLLADGLPECEFMARVRAEIGAPGTCSLGYNTIRFDDEFTRHASFRNFFDAYTQEYQDGNSRWDLIDVVRLCRALRPDGIEWPVDEDGRAVNRLDRLTIANGIAHANAHDALADVEATIALARLLRERQPRLFDYALAHRDKVSAADLLDLSQRAPVLWATSRIPPERNQIAPVVPLMRHPDNPNALLVADLGVDPANWLPVPHADWRLPPLPSERVAGLPAGATTLPVLTLKTNACPVLAPLSTLRPADGMRLGIDAAEATRFGEHLATHWTDDCAAALTALLRERRFDPPIDIDDSLYAGKFFSPQDKRLFDAIHRAAPAALGAFHGQFADARGDEMLFRYRARNYPDSLDDDEQERWREHVLQRLDAAGEVPWLTFTRFTEALDAPDWTPDEAGLRDALRRYGQCLRQRYPVESR